MSKLYKPDNSKQGNVDKEIAYLIDKINDSDKYYTTSSCAGRIVLIMIPKSGRKDEAEWVFKSHNLVEFENLPLDKFPEEPVWFRQESAIFHVCCKTIEDAQSIVNKAKTAGFKRSGIMATTKRIMVELTSTESIDVPITRKGELLVNEDYIKILINEANKKLKRSRDKVDKFFKLL